ncbi:MAG: glycosyltransferase [Alphaproteobacteria bacterium]|nr:glycosyltransferase [Alphaproteobacteria bacterium]
MTDTTAGMRGALRQAMTVVVMPLAGEPALGECLKAVSAQADIVVIARPEPGPEDQSVPARRLRALKAAKTDLVAFLEDTCIPDPGWYAAIHDAFENPEAAAVGGPVEISRLLPARFRALGICEYARFQASRLPTAGDPVRVGSLAGANFAVRKSAIGDVTSATDMVDNAMFASLRARGPVLMDRKASVTYAAQDRHGARLSTRYHHGRIYGGGQFAGKPLMLRLALAARTVAVPAVLTIRSFRDAPGWLWRAPQVMLWIMMMHGRWGVGEFLGIATGRIGRSLKEWT